MTASSEHEQEAASEKVELILGDGTWNLGGVEAKTTWVAGRW